MSNLYHRSSFKYLKIQMHTLENYRIIILIQKDIKTQYHTSQLTII